MYDRFTERARAVVVEASEVGRELAHPHVGVEHLLLGELAVPEGLGGWALESLGIERETARAALARLVAPAQMPAPTMVPFTDAARCALERSLIEVQSRSLRSVGTEHLLLGICAELESRGGDEVPVRLLAELGVTTAQIRAALAPFILERPTALSWSLRRTPELEFRALPGSDWGRVLAVPAELTLRRLVLDAAAVAFDAGRGMIESADLLAAADGVATRVSAETRDWRQIEAGPAVRSALVRAGRVASKRAAAAVTVADLIGPLRVDQRALIERAGAPLSRSGP